MKPVIVRRIVQGLSLVFFVALFALAAYPLRSHIPVDLLLRLDPLAAAVSFLASRTIVAQMLLSLVLLGATLFLGRFFCGYLCPLGTGIDLTDGLLGWMKLSRFKLKSVPRVPKYILLAFVLIAALFGISLIWPFDPLVIFTRALTVLFYPAAIFLANKGLDLFRPLAERWELEALADAGLTQPLYRSWIAPLVILILILGLGLLGRRFWCRALCPLGALLALASRFSPLKRLVREGSCRHCGLCRQGCPMGAVEEDETDIVLGECIECRVCVSLCPQKAVSFAMGKPRQRGKLDWDRRRLIQAAVVGAISVSAAKLIPRQASSHPRRIRPPGAVPEDIFLDRCLRCGECMKVCITNGLQPALGEAGPLGVWTPVLIPRKGPCERHCHLCGQVCPTQAIRSLTLEEKSYARIGQARVEPTRCLEWGYGKVCLVCDEVCPYGAIFVGRSQTSDRRGPVVDAQLCVGCGVCEQHCPVIGEAAIRVGSWNEDRQLKDSYITPDKVSARERALRGDGPGKE